MSRYNIHFQQGQLQQCVKAVTTLQLATYLLYSLMMHLTLRLAHAGIV